MAIKTIVVKGEGIRFEALANAGITPGHLVEIMSTGKMRVHATAGGNAEKAFAVEDDIQGNNIDHAYSADDLVQYEIFRPGDVVLAMLANGQNVAIGDKLESSGTGTLTKYAADSQDPYEDTIVGVAMEAVNMSDSSLADPSGRIKVRIV